MGHTSVSINKSGKKWTTTVFWASMFSRSKDVEEFDSFEEAYRSVRDYDEVSIDWHPPWMQKAIDKVKKEVEDKEKAELETKEKAQLGKLKQKYEK